MIEDPHRLTLKDFHNVMKILTAHFDNRLPTALKMDYEPYHRQSFEHTFYKYRPDRTMIITMKVEIQDVKS